MSETPETDRVVESPEAPVAAPPTAVELPASPEKPPDPFDPESLRIEDDYGALSVRRELVTIPIHKPSKEAWFRTHPDDAYWLKTFTLELRDEEREQYLIAPVLWTALAEEPTVRRKLIATCITRQGLVFLWPLNLPGADGRSNPWNDSARRHAETARGRWIRMFPGSGFYEVCVCDMRVPEPEWPQKTMAELLRIAFADKLIADLSHPVLRRLRGEL